MQIINDNSITSLISSNIRRSPLDLTAAKTNSAFKNQLELIKNTYNNDYWNDPLSCQLHLLLKEFYHIEADDFESLLNHVLVEEIHYESIDNPVLIDGHTWERRKLEKYLNSCAFILQQNDSEKILQPLELFDSTPDLEQLLQWFVSQNIPIESPFRGQFLLQTIHTHDYAIDILDLFYPDDLGMPPVPASQGFALIMELSLTKSTYICAVEGHFQKQEVREIHSIVSYLSDGAQYIAKTLEIERHKQEKLYLEGKQVFENQMLETANRIAQQIRGIVEIGQKHAENQLAGLNQEFSLKTSFMQQDVQTNTKTLFGALNNLTSRLNTGEARSKWLEQKNNLNQAELQKLQNQSQQNAIEINNLKKKK